MQMDYNDVAGDCTDACLANVLDVVAAILKYAGSTIPAANVKSWAIAQGFYDGANIPDVLTALQTVPMIDANGQGRIIGAFAGVDYTNLPAVYDALSDCYALDLGGQQQLLPARQRDRERGTASDASDQQRRGSGPLDSRLRLRRPEYLATQYHDFYGDAVDLSPISSGPPDALHRHRDLGQPVHRARGEFPEYHGRGPRDRIVPAAGDDAAGGRAARPTPSPRGGCWTFCRGRTGSTSATRSGPWRSPAAETIFAG